MSAATPLPAGSDFACLVSRSALDGTAAHTLEDTMNRVRDYYGRDAREQFNYRPGGTR